MNRTTSIILGVLLVALVARDAAAQWNVARFKTGRNTVYATAGLDPALVTALGYARVIELVGHDFQFNLEGGLAAAHLDSRDFRARAGIGTSLLRWRSINLTGSATFNARGTENVLYRGFDYGADFTAALGVYRRGWFAAAEFGKDKAVITHVTHSDWYRTNYYPDARDGWYLDAGGTFHYGLSSGVALGPAEVTLRAGWLRTEKWDDMLPPMYASMGLGVRF